VQWDRNEGRWTCVLSGQHEGIVVHAAKVEGGWELIIPALLVRELIRNVHLKTWLTAQPIVERTLEALLTWEDPHALQPGEEDLVPKSTEPARVLPEEQRPPWARAAN
jgi:hypothetical protein